MGNNYILIFGFHVAIIVVFYSLRNSIELLGLRKMLIVYFFNSLVALIFSIPVLNIVALFMCLILCNIIYKRNNVKIKLSYKRINLLVLLAIGMLLGVVNHFYDSVVIFSISTAILLNCFVLVMVNLWFVKKDQQKINCSKNVVFVADKNTNRDVVLLDEDCESLKITLEAIHKWFDDSKCYLNPEYSINQLQKDIEIDRKVVSQAINKIEGINFYQFLASYRIKYAKSVLKSNDRYTLESLSSECGFYSKSSFNKYFKYFEGETPSRFKLKQI